MPTSLAAPEQEGISDVLRISRSPHPYYRRKVPSSSTSTLSLSESEGTTSRGKDGAVKKWYSRSPSESGTEADDEAIGFAKLLPSSPIRSRKGLKSDWDLHVSGKTSQSNASKSHHGKDFSGDPTNPVLSEYKTAPGKEEGRNTRELFRQELLRRGSEILSLAMIGGILFRNSSSTEFNDFPKAEFLSHVLLVAILSVMFVVRHLSDVLFSTPSTCPRMSRLPTSFDPAVAIYPTFLPVLVSLALSPSRSEILLPNVVLSLSSLPAVIIPTLRQYNCNQSLHWMLTMVPLWAGSYKAAGTGASIRTNTMNGELLALLYPLHRSLSQLLQYLTTTSLLSSELYLLSTSLINILLFSASPQSIVLQSIIWAGGMGLFVLCTNVLRWNVALERIPAWRFRTDKRSPRSVNKKQFSGSKKPFQPDGSSSDGDMDNGIAHALPDSGDVPLLTTLCTTLPVEIRRRLSLPESVGDNSNNHRNGIRTGNGKGARPLLRSYTSPLTLEVGNSTRRRRRFSLTAQAYLSMTPRQVESRKRLYAAYAFTVVVVLVLAVIRPAIAARALHGYEPFGWAVGYLFGDTIPLRTFVYNQGLEDWIVLSDDIFDNESRLSNAGRVEKFRRRTIGAANTRLLLFAYWFTVVSIGIAVVLRLSAFAEVDTRRKVFHGMMVIMLLPTTFVDPAFLSLALILVLAVFLLLDLFRAAQLRPISKPLASFLTPYVDGRDLQGPVIVSHIFLLIGCAIPFWLSLAGVKREGTDPWHGWEVATRDVSMIAGVVCVGMGDAAASLVGRRIGRHKWPWPGGKSLEGSTAFALAVTLGLMVGKAWLKIGGWTSTIDDSNDSWLTILAKAGIAACGASFTEAVLTGCNDNVVVPVVLWLLVSALQL